MQAVVARQSKVKALRAKGVEHNEAIRQTFEAVEVAADHPAYDSLSMECIAVVDGDMYGLSLDHLLGEEQ